MGSPKALLPFRGGRTFLDQLVEVYSEIGCDVVLVLSPSVSRLALGSGRPRSGSLWLAINREPDGDRLSSIRLGLALVPVGSAVFLQDVDRPFVTPQVLRALLERLDPNGYAAPDLGGRGGHPVLVAPSVADALRSDRRSRTLRDGLAGFERTLVDVGEQRCDLNINTPELYRLHVSAEAFDAA
jgi:CTP:molybdopterin cytidylyltransferase MocA